VSSESIRSFDRVLSLQTSGFRNYNPPYLREQAKNSERVHVTSSDADPLVDRIIINEKGASLIHESYFCDLFHTFSMYITI